MDLDLHKQLILALVQQQDPRERISLSLIFLQLQSFLNVRLDKLSKHKLKKYAKSQITQYKAEYEHDKKDESLSSEKIKELDIIIDNIDKKRNDWLDLLFVKNIGPLTDYNSHDDNEEPVTYMKNNEEAQHYMNLYCANNVKLEMLSSKAKLISLKPESIILQKRLRLLSSKRQYCKSYKDFDDSLLQNGDILLYNWDEKIQNLLNIIHPLASYEVLGLIHRYITVNNLLEDDKLKIDNRLLFLTDTFSKNETNAINDLDIHISQFKKEEAGKQLKNGKRVDNKGNEIPVSLYLP